MIIYRNIIIRLNIRLLIIIIYPLQFSLALHHFLVHFLNLARLLLKENAQKFLSLPQPKVSLYPWWNFNTNDFSRIFIMENVFKFCNAPKIFARGPLGPARICRLPLENLFAWQLIGAYPVNFTTRRLWLLRTCIETVYLMLLKIDNTCVNLIIILKYLIKYIFYNS